MRSPESSLARVVLRDAAWFSPHSAQVLPNTPLDGLAKDTVEDYILAQYRFCKVLNEGIEGA
jgi:hypothetical protein